MSAASSDDNFWESLDDALDAPMPSATPAHGRYARKRTASEAELSSDDERDQPSSPSPASLGATGSTIGTESTPLSQPILNRNLVAVARRVATHKKLRADHAHELEDFAANTVSVQNVKLFGRLLAIEAHLSKVVSTPPPFEVSKDSDLYINMVSYGNAVFFSSKLAAYKGTVALNHLLDIVKQRRFGIPKGLEHNKASWNKVLTVAQNIFTQIRGSVKKEIKKSVAKQDPLQHANIFALTERILQGTDLKITVPVMARIALMRNIFLRAPGDSFWDAIDERLNKLQQKCNSPEKLTRAFKLILDKDREQHGGDFDEPDVNEFATDELQQDVDEGITRTTAQRAMSLVTEAMGVGAEDGSQNPGTGRSTPGPLALSSSPIPSASLTATTD